MTSSQVKTLSAILLIASGIAVLVLTDTLWLTVAAATGIALGFVLQSRRTLRTTQALDRRVGRQSRQIRKAIAQYAGDLETSVAGLHGELGRQRDQVISMSTALTRAVLEEVAEVDLNHQSAISSLKKRIEDVARTIDSLRSDINSLREPPSQTEHLERLQAAATNELDALVAIYSTLGFGRPLPAFRGWAMTAAGLRKIVNEVLSRPSTIVLEIGSGVSTVVLARVMELKDDGSRLLTIEHEESWATRTRELLSSHGLANHATVLTCPLTVRSVSGKEATWYEIPESAIPSQVDVVLVDGPPRSTGPAARYPALPLLAERLRDGAVVYLDDADRPDEREILQRWAEEYPDWRTRYSGDAPRLAELRRRADDKI